MSAIKVERVNNGTEVQITMSIETARNLVGELVNTHQSGMHCCEDLIEALDDAHSDVLQ